MNEQVWQVLDINVADNFRKRLLGNGRSRNTAKMYGYIVENYLKFIDYRKENITREDIEKFKEYLSLEKGYSKSTIYLYIRAIQSFIQFLGIGGIGQLNPPKRPQKVPNYLVGNEVSIIMRSCGSIRERLIVELLVYTGIRVSELCSIRTQDMNLENKTLKIRSGKGDKDRLVVFSERVIPDLKLYMMETREKRKRNDFLFPTSKSRRVSPVTIERVIREVVKRSGISKKVTPHTFRHTFATTLLRNGADLRIIQELLGHASISTTQIYTHVDDRALRLGYDKFSPKY